MSDYPRTRFELKYDDAIQDISDLTLELASLKESIPIASSQMTKEITMITGNLLNSARFLQETYKPIEIGAVESINTASVEATKRAIEEISKVARSVAEKSINVGINNALGDIRTSLANSITNVQRCTVVLKESASEVKHQLSWRWYQKSIFYVLSIVLSILLSIYAYRVIEKKFPLYGIETSKNISRGIFINEVWPSLDDATKNKIIGIWNGRIK